MRGTGYAIGEILIFLAIAAIVTLLWGNSIAGWYQGLF